MNYQDHVGRRLQEVYDIAEDRQLDLESARYVIFSDHHKGQRDGADDFLRCEKAYHAALGYYFEAGFTLVLLGDVEELWECRPKKVIESYRYTLELEAEFYSHGRYLRFFGNHDDEWEFSRSVSRYLNEWFPDIHVLEGLRLSVVEGAPEEGTLFLVHGHQGTKFSDRSKTVGKYVVRYVWRPLQRLWARPSTTPATDFKLREEHDRKMYKWAASQPGKVALIAGHTHRPVFFSRNHGMAIARKLESARLRLSENPSSANLQHNVAQLRAQLEWAKSERNGQTGDISSAEYTRPCYFNTGCCSFGDGDITGLEIAEGKINLVRWPDDDEQLLPQILATADIACEVFAAL